VTTFIEVRMFFSSRCSFLTGIMSTFGVFMVLLAVVSAVASSSLLDGLPSVYLGIQGQLLTTVESIKPFSDIGQVAHDFSNCTNLLTAVGDFAGLISGLYDYQLIHFTGVSTDYMVAHMAAGCVLAVGVYWLRTDRHFPRPTCAAFSRAFWLADVWVVVMLCPIVGVVLALYAYGKRGSWLLFPRKFVFTTYSVQELRQADCRSCVTAVLVFSCFSCRFHCRDRA
jgi:hypothetical protein